MSKVNEIMSHSALKPSGPVIYEISKGASIWPKLRYVHRSHEEDLQTALSRRGRSPDEFEVSDTPSRIGPPSVERQGVIHGPVVTVVTVRSRKSGVVRNYEARSIGQTDGPFTEWVNLFARDLDDGLFG
jgi:hypothetical protein